MCGTKCALFCEVSNGIKGGKINNNTNYTIFTVFSLLAGLKHIHNLRRQPCLFNDKHRTANLKRKLSAYVQIKQ
jgi:hypothetical protein